MKTLAYFLNEVSREQQSSNWFYVINLDRPEIMQPIIDEACARYTMQCCEAVRLRCMDNAFIKKEIYEGEITEYIDKKSILNTEIVLP